MFTFSYVSCPEIDDIDMYQSSSSESSADLKIKRQLFKAPLNIRLSTKKLDKLSIPSHSDDKTPDAIFSNNDLLIDGSDIGPFSLDCNNLKRKKTIRFQEDYGLGEINEDFSKNFSTKKIKKNKTSFFTKCPIDDEFEDLRGDQIRFNKSMPKEFRSSSIFEKLEEKFNSSIKEQA